MFGSKKFDVYSSDHIIIDGVRYVGTLGLYLFSKKFPTMIYRYIYRRR